MLRLVVGAALVYAAILPPTISTADGLAMLAMSESLATGNGFTVPEAIGLPGRGGAHYSAHYPLISILAVPFVAVGQAVSRVAGLPSTNVAAVFALLLQVLVSAATVGVVALLVRRLGGSWKEATAAAIAFGFGTIALVYVRTFFADPLAALLAGTGLWLVFSAGRHRIMGAAGVSLLAVGAKPTGVVVGPVLSGYLFLKGRRREAVWPIAGTFIGGLFYLGYNWLRFGSFSSFAGQDETYSSFFSVGGVLEGFAGLLVSPGYGLVWFSPVVLLAVVGGRIAWQRHSTEVLAILAMFFAYLVLHSTWEFWVGGWSWGPRFMLPTLPGLLALAGLAITRHRTLFLVLFAAGFIVTAPTIATSYERYFAEFVEQPEPDFDALAWSPESSIAVNVWGAAGRQLRAAATTDVGELVRSAGSPDTVSESATLRIVALWWWMLPLVGLSPWLGAAVSLLMIGVGLRLMLSAPRIIDSASRAAPAVPHPPVRASGSPGQP